MKTCLSQPFPYQMNKILNRKKGDGIIKEKI